jgi:CRISPR/Cas system-associated exonuclease Cas4 (RecB family)
LKSFALPLIRLLAELPEAASWGGWIDRLREIAETALRDPGRPLALLEELGPMRAAGPVTLGEVYSVLEERLRFLRRDPPLRRYGRLFVSTPEEARGRVFDHVFVLGLAEGIFPQRTQEDPLLLDVYRRPLGLKLRDHRVERERLLLRIPAAAAQSGFVASYPRLDTAQSRPRVPSFYALEVARAVEGRLPELRAFEAGAAQGAPARIGWPAPPDPAEAIDNAEYDLARLEQFTERGVEAARGWGRYLVELSDPLTRSLRARWKRWRPRWFDADGLVDPESGALELLRDSSLARQAYSPSALQQFTACPYRFFLQGVVRLRPREEPEPLAQMDPLTRGVLFHRAQQRLLEGLKSESRWPVTAATFSDAMDLADQELSRAAVDLAEDLAPAIPRVWRNEVEALRTDLRGWLREIAQEGAEWYPLHVEREFEQALPNGLRVRGVADLVEQHGVTRLLRITDHKTGKPPEGPRLGYVGGGAVLQPLLYAVALELALDQPVDRARLYYCTQRGGFRQTEIRLDQRARAYLTGALDVIQRSIVEGFLPAYPAKDACGKCEYLDLCGPYEELRTKSKPKPRLEPLLALRSMP